MGKCRLLNELSEEDAKISAFPEDDLVDQEEIDEVDPSSLDRIPIQVDSNIPSDVIDTAHRDRGGGRKKSKTPSAVPGDNKIHHKYNLRSKL